MNEEQKALDILEKVNNGKISKELWQNCSEYAKQDLKRKAYIVVDEILEIPVLLGGWQEGINLPLNNRQRPYWQEVRNKIGSFNPQR